MTYDIQVDACWYCSFRHGVLAVGREAREDVFRCGAGAIMVHDSQHGGSWGSWSHGPIDFYLKFLPAKQIEEFDFYLKFLPAKSRSSISI